MTKVGRSFYLVYLFWWLIWIFLQSIILHRFNFNWNISVADSLLTNSLLALAGFAIEKFYRFNKPGFDNPFLRFANVLGITFACLWCLNYFIELIFVNETNYLLFFQKSIPIRFTFSLLMISFITVFSWLWYFMKDKEASINRKIVAEKLLKDAELSSLQLKLQPHFLFNCLNSINSLIINKPNEAQNMVLKLSEFLRGTMRSENSQLVKLHQEIKQIEIYLEIEKVRFGHRLNTVLEIDDSTNEMNLPSLILQPLFENAIKFGLYGTLDEISIKAKATMQNGNLVFILENPFEQQTPGSSIGTGFGLMSVHRRLNLIYSRNDLVKINQTQNLFSITLTFPQIND